MGLGRSLHETSCMADNAPQERWMGCRGDEAVYGMWDVVR